MKKLSLGTLKEEELELFVPLGPWCLSQITKTNGDVFEKYEFPRVFSHADQKKKLMMK